MLDFVNRVQAYYVHPGVNNYNTLSEGSLKDILRFFIVSSKWLDYIAFTLWV